MMAGPSNPPEMVRTSFGGTGSNPLKLDLRLKNTRNILMELRKICQHPYISAPMLEDERLPDVEAQKRLIQASGKLVFLKQLLPKLKERGHRVLLFSQFKIALDRIADFLGGEGIKFLRLDGDIQQAVRQKMIDRYNAPGSDIFIFILSTRAGGVGINLATADTIIIYDPDFNPHQDLQAIARAHRFGQTKPVLVFKLMVKDSVEEQIVFKGKKKMVLDHLVVQNLNSTDEEVDIDSIIMHGAKALYEKSEETGNDRGIVYNSKNIDEMIDQMERQAEAEAKELAEKWRLEDEAKARGEKAEASKEAKTFGFAKIWEVGDGEAKEVEEIGEDREMEDVDGGLEHLLRHTNMNRSEAQRGGANSRTRTISAAEQMRRDRKAQYVKELEDALAMEATPVKKRPKGKGKKGKGREEESDSADGDFTMIVEDNSDSDYGGGDEPGLGEVVMEDLGVLAEPDRPMGTKGIVNEPHGAEKAAKALRRAQKKQDRLNRAKEMASVPLPAPATNAVAAPSRTETTLEAAQMEALRFEMLQAQFEQTLAGGEGETLDDYNASWNPYARTPTPLAPAPAAAPSPVVVPPAPSAPSPPIAPPRKIHPIPNPISVPPSTTTGPRTSSAKSTESDTLRRMQQLSKMKEGQDVLQWLYHVLREFVIEDELISWAKIGLTELSLAEREGHYTALAWTADERLSALGYERFFSLPKVRDAVTRLIKGKGPILPSSSTSSVESSLKAVLQYPRGMTRGARGAVGDVGTSRSGTPGTGGPGPVASAPSAPGSNIPTPTGMLNQASLSSGPAATHPSNVSGQNPSSRAPLASRNVAATTTQRSLHGGPGSSPTSLRQLPKGSTVEIINSPTLPSTASVAAGSSPHIALSSAQPKLNANAGTSAQSPTTGGRPTESPGPMQSSQPSPASCPICKVSGHAFVNCERRKDPQDLRQLKHEVMTGAISLTPAKKVDALAKTAALERTYRDRSAGVGPSTKGNAVASGSGGQQLAKRAHPNTDGTPQKRQRTILPAAPPDGQTVISAASLLKPTGRATGGPGAVIAQSGLSSACEFCHSRRGHPPMACPLILGGTATMRPVLELMPPNDPRYQALGILYRQAHDAEQAQVLERYHANLRQQANQQPQQQRAMQPNPNQQLPLSLTQPPPHTAPPQQQPEYSPQQLQQFQQQLQQFHQQQQRQQQQRQQQQQQQQLQQGPVCPFCQQHCGRALQACAEAHGGRKALKALIKQVDVPGQIGQPQHEARLDPLYKLYQDWKK